VSDFSHHEKRRKKIKSEKERKKGFLYLLPPPWKSRFPLPGSLFLWNPSISSWSGSWICKAELISRAMEDRKKERGRERRRKGW
jgi:hypothetical protein